MRTRAWLVALVAVVCGVALAVALLGGGDDQESRQAGAAGPVGGPPVTGAQRPAVPPQARDRGNGDRGRGDRKRGPERPRHARPGRVASGGEAAAQAVESTLGKEVIDGQPTILSSVCRDGTCLIRYRTLPEGGGKILQDHAEILARVLRRSTIRTVRALVYEPTRGPQSEEIEQVLDITCDRDALLVGGRVRATAKAISRKCKVVATEHDPHEGKGGGSNRVPGAEPGGAADPTVDGTKEAERASRARPRGHR